MARLFPTALRPGDEVAVVSPASGVRDRAALERGLARIREWGFLPTLMPHALESLDWPEGCTLAASDAARLDDLQCALTEPRYRAVLCMRGGYGAARLLPDLDLAPLAGDPKPVVGYSDITALLAAVFAESGLIGFHGPMVATTDAMDPGDAGWALQRRLLTETDVPAALPETEAPRGLRPGTAEGPLVGGNLALVQSLIGTPWEVDTRGALLFLEDVGEPPYRVDRMLTQLHQTGALERAAGIILGDFHLSGTPLASEQPSMLHVLNEQLAHLQVPVARGFPIGHRPGAWTLPYGGRARLDVPDSGHGADTESRATLELLDPAVCEPGDA